MSAPVIWIATRKHQYGLELPGCVADSLRQGEFVTYPSLFPREQCDTIAAILLDGYAELDRVGIDEVIVHRDGTCIVALDSSEITYRPGAGWFLDDQLVDDLPTALRRVLAKRH